MNRLAPASVLLLGLLALGAVLLALLFVSSVSPRRRGNVVNRDLKSLLVDLAMIAIVGALVVMGILILAGPR